MPKYRQVFTWEGEDGYSRVLQRWLVKHQRFIVRMLDLRQIWGLDWGEIYNNLDVDPYWFNVALNVLYKVGTPRSLEKRCLRDPDMAEAIRYVGQMRRAG